MQHKMRLAREIVSQFNGDTAAQEAEALFVSTFRDRELPPTDVPILRVRFEKIRGLLLSGKWARMSMLSSDDLLLERPDAAIDDGGVRIHLFVETLETPPKQAAAEIARSKN